MAYPSQPPRSESRLKALFWPSIQTGSDVDYLGAQGYWLCTVLAVLSCVISFATGRPLVGTLVFLFYYGGGIGVRQRSHYAAGVVFVLFLADTIFAGVSVFRILMGALLLSNVRATWIAADWKPNAEEAVMPVRLSETWSDKFVDQLPEWVWPKVRIPYYVFSGCVLFATFLGLAAMILHRAF